MRAKVKPAPTADQYAAAAALREALRIFQRRTELVAAQHDLTPRMYQLLLMVKTGRADGERATLGELEQRLQLATSTITELVVRAQDRGLVRRELDPERRGAIRIGLTAVGKKRLAAACSDLGDERRRLADLLANLELV
jgi:DNA-binding MarR family transcriptional regulator